MWAQADSVWLQIVPPTDFLATMAVSKALSLADVNCKTPCFVGPLAFSLNLGEGDVEAKEVVYLLRCAPQITGGPFTWYVGRVPRFKLAYRMKKHMAGTATDYTAQNKPLALEALYPAARKSVEAYVFFSMMEKLPVAAISSGRLGGWTQTRPVPSQTCALLLKEQKRMLSDSCLACGSSSHFCTDAACPKKHWPDSAPLHCDHCHATVEITALGQTRTRPPPGVAAAVTASGVAAAGGVKRSASQPPESQPPSQRRALAPSAPQPPSRRWALAPSAPTAPGRRDYARAQICGREYTTIAWYLGKTASEKERKGVVARLEGRAVELRQGDHKTLVTAGFAKTQRPKELLPGRTNLSAAWLDTVCKTARPPHQPLQVRRGCSSRNALWPVEDLVAHFKS